VAKEGRPCKNGALIIEISDTCAACHGDVHRVARRSAGATADDALRVYWGHRRRESRTQLLDRGRRGGALWARRVGGGVSGNGVVYKLN
jgi:hypothetical protein